MIYKVKPLVSIGVPCYNRPEGLEKLLYSLVSQTYKNIEIIISDNASDEVKVKEIGSNYAENDARVRYFRQEKNIGALNNFIFVRECSTGIYFMWAADDDVFSIDYVEKCIECLEKNIEVVLAAGVAIYRKPDSTIYNGVNVSIENDDPTERFLYYFRTAIDNGILYGIYRNSIFTLLSLDKNFIGNDWYVLAQIAYIGKIKVIESTFIIREASHLFRENPWRYLCNMYGLPKFAERVPWRWVAMEINFFLRKEFVIPDKSKKEFLAEAAYKILLERFDRKNKGIVIKLYDLVSRLYYPFFVRKMRRS